ncbi:MULTISPECIES: hypothetical protein [Halorubrum]|uniref:Uncharacterized protein n=1 Tax=Halorubrum hochstenium ATCC 700873 TaxID=1227481 RepID=M0F7B2_9EURY|nr:MULTISPECIES: hypothetical protein [Halorubrum]ELZ55906.1 hypothetical protein C467_08989 [Halorubrum hochstenium ATCC 700873]
MERLYVFSGALAVIGLSTGMPAIRSLAAGDHGVGVLLAAVGGVVLVATAGYESVRTDPEEFTVPGGGLLLLIGAACLTLLGTVLSELPGV